MKLSNSFVITIHLNHSKDYLKLTAIVYTVTLWVIYQSGIYILIKILFIFLLINQFYIVWKNPQPLQSIHSITMKQTSWILHDSVTGDSEYESAKRLIDMGMFQLVKFIHQDKKKVLIVFGDQMKLEDGYAFRRRVSAG